MSAESAVEMRRSTPDDFDGFYDGFAATERCTGAAASSMAASKTC